jgi:phosphoglycolate phosphatase-like HAD superfamily hydrolase
MNIFFDFDGTIVDISNRHYEVYTRCISVLNGKPLSKDDYWNGKRQDMRWPQILELSSIDPSNEEDFLNRFIDLIEDTELLKIDTLFDGSRDVLQRLTQNHNLILVSLRRNHDNLIGQLKYLGLDHFFSSILSGHSGTREGVLLKKAEVIREISGYNEGIIIGDTEADIAASKQLQIPVIAVTTGIRDRKFLVAYEPDYIVDSIVDAEDVINQLQS